MDINGNFTKYDTSMWFTGNTSEWCEMNQQYIFVCIYIYIDITWHDMKWAGWTEHIQQTPFWSGKNKLFLVSWNIAVKSKHGFWVAVSCGVHIQFGRLAPRTVGRVWVSTLDYAEILQLKHRPQRAFALSWPCRRLDRCWSSYEFFHTAGPNFSR